MTAHARSFDIQKALPEAEVIDRLRLAPTPPRHRKLQGITGCGSCF